MALSYGRAGRLTAQNGDFRRGQGCAECPPGSITGTLTGAGATSCEACERGRYSAVPTEACIKCDAGKFLPATGRALEANCIACPIGTYGAAEGGTKPGSCADCPDNSFSPLGTAALTGCFCVPGFTKEGDACTACPSGKAKADFADATCVDCPAGRTTEGLEHTAVVCDCNAGHAGEDSTAACTVCPANTFKPPPAELQELPTSSASFDCYIPEDQGAITEMEAYLFWEQDTNFGCIMQKTDGTWVRFGSVCATAPVPVELDCAEVGAACSGSVRNDCEDGGCVGEPTTGVILAKLALADTSSVAEDYGNKYTLVDGIVQGYRFGNIGFQSPGFATCSECHLALKGNDQGAALCDQNGALEVIFSIFFWIPNVCSPRLHKTPGPHRRYPPWRQVLLRHRYRRLHRKELRSCRYHDMGGF